jgi:hypothetical protein
MLRAGAPGDRANGNEARVAKLAQSLVNFEKQWAVLQTLAIIAGRAAMKECQHKRSGHAKDISE